MNSRMSVYVLVLILLFTGIVSARGCKRACFCSAANSRADKAVENLKNANHVIDNLRGKKIALGTDFALRVTNNGITVGYIYDEFSPVMTLPQNSNIEIVSRHTLNSNDVKIYYDTNYYGLFTNLATPGNYTASQISLPRRSISSIVVPNGYEAILYAEDNFQGDHIVLAGSHQNLGKFNDKTQSIQIVKTFKKNHEHLAVVYSYPEYAGKQQGITLGNNTMTSSQIKSIEIDTNYEVLIYNNDMLIDVISSSSRKLDTISQNTILTVVLQKISKQPTEYAVFYEHADFKGSRFFVNTQSNGRISHADGKLSSMRIPNDYEVVLFEEADFKGTYVVASSDVNNLNFYAFNDRAKSILVRPKITGKSVENVAIYTKPHYGGERMTVPVGLSECSSSLKLLNFCSDVYAASIKIPSGFKVTITKAPTPITKSERVYTYVEDTPEIRNYLDTLIVSVLVEKL